MVLTSVDRDDLADGLCARVVCVCVCVFMCVVCVLKSTHTNIHAHMCAGGCHHIAETIQLIKEDSKILVECLSPDFLGVKEYGLCLLLLICLVEGLSPDCSGVNALCCCG